jgi:apolipoprotein N-acyltransferase
MNKNLRFLWLFIATVLGLFIGGKWNIPLAAWIAPLFFIRFFRDSEKAGRNFLLLWLTSAVSTIIAWNGATFFPPLAEAAFFLVMTPISLIPYVVDRLYARRFPQAAWVSLIFPIAYTAVDFFTSSGSPFGTFGAIAYSQRGFLPVMQLASITGLWGITFVMGWFAGLANHIWENGFKFTRFAFVSTCILLIGFLLGFGRILLKPQPEQTPVITGFSLPNETIHQMMTMLNLDNDETGFRQAADEQNARQLEQIRVLAQDGANIVVLQESAIMGMTDQVEAVMRDASVIAEEENIYIVLPTFDLGKEPAVNSVHIIDPNGQVVLTHVKYGGNQFEGTLKGDGVLQTVDTPYGKLSAVICWDADFPNVIKQVGKKNVDLLFVPSNDWLGVKDIHAGMATFRAVENGVSIFRQTGQGVSSAIDVFGKEVSRVDMFAENGTGVPGSQMVEMQIGSVNTLYSTLGDALGNVMLLGFVGLLIGLFFTRKR